MQFNSERPSLKSLKPQHTPQPKAELPKPIKFSRSPSKNLAEEFKEHYGMFGQMQKRRSLADLKELKAAPTRELMINMTARSSKKHIH